MAEEAATAADAARHAAVGAATILHELDSEELAWRAKQGCQASFTELVHRYAPRLQAFLRRKTRPRHEVEDLVQDTLIKAYQNLDQYDRTWKFSTWLFTIARNLCTDNARRGALRKADSLDQTPQPARDDSGPHRIEKIAGSEGNAEKAAMNREIAVRVDRAVAELPVDQREVFLMREVMDMSFAEIAAATKTSEPTVKSRMRYALERLRAALGELSDQPDSVALGSI